MAVDFSFLDDLFTDEGTSDYTDVGLFDEAGNYNPASADYLDDLSTSYDLDFSYDPSNYGIGSFDIGDLLDIDSYIDDNPVFDDAGNYMDLFQEYTGPGTVEEQVANFTDNFINNQDYSNLFDDDENLIPSLNFGDEDDYEGIFGLGVGPKLKDFFLGTEDSAGFLGGLLGGSGNNKKSGGSSTGLAGLLQGLMGGGANNNGLFGGSGLETLIKLAMINKLRKQDRDDPNEVVPIGSDAFAAVGQGQGLGTMPDYRTFNIQPALMPGVGYANAPPPGMKQGGVSDGPGDITLARLEPGEFVMTRKATDNIGAKNLYKLMKNAERMN